MNFEYLFEPRALFNRIGMILNDFGLIFFMVPKAKCKACEEES